MEAGSDEELHRGISGVECGGGSVFMDRLRQIGWGQVMERFEDLDLDYLVSQWSL